MKTATLTLLAALALGGCATCQNHPAACALAGSVLVTSIALSAGGHDHDVRARHLVPHYSPCEHGQVCGQ